MGYRIEKAFVGDKSSPVRVSGEDRWVS